MVKWMGRNGIKKMDIGMYKATYIGSDIQGFEHNKEYVFKLEHKPNSCYEIIELNDDLYMVLSSEISMKQNFKNIKKED